MSEADGRALDEWAAINDLFHAVIDATEIRPALAISPSGVRSRLARLITRLRMELEDV